MGAFTMFLKILGKILTVVQTAAPLAEIAGRVLMPGRKTGPQKLQIVRESIKQTLLASEIVVGRDIVDEELLDSAIDDFAAGASKLEKALRPKGA